MAREATPHPEAGAVVRPVPSRPSAERLLAPAWPGLRLGMGKGRQQAFERGLGGLGPQHGRTGWGGLASPALGLRLRVRKLRLVRVARPVGRGRHRRGGRRTVRRFRERTYGLRVRIVLWSPINESDRHRLASTPSFVGIAQGCSLRSRPFLAIFVQRNSPVIDAFAGVGHDEKIPAR